MGRITILATDIFFCVFGIFAALRTIVPQYEFVDPVYPAITVEWFAAQMEHCFFGAAYVETGAGSSTQITATPAYTGDTCSVTTGLEITDGAPEISVYLLLPILQTGQAATVKVSGYQVDSPGISGEAHQTWTFKQ